MKEIAIVLLVVLLSCDNNKYRLKSHTVIKFDNYQLNEKMDSSFYQYEDETYKQVVDIKKISDKEISFIISTRNKKLNYLSILKGTAIKNFFNSEENDEDENGLTYLCNEYYFQKEHCEVFLKFLFHKEFLNGKIRRVR